MKKELLSILLMLLPMLASAAVTVEIDGIWYNLVPKAKLAEVTSNPNGSSSYSGSIEIPASVTYKEVKCDVTSISEDAFWYCWGLTSVTIPNSVTSIGDNAFRRCSDLKSVTIGNSVTSIGEGAFFECSGLTSVTIPNSVTSIGDLAFDGCSGLTSVTISNSVTSIGKNAFCGCSGLTSVTIPSSVTSIDVHAFSGCSGLTSVTIPSSVTSIGDYAFSGCISLTSVTIPNSVTSIGKQAFVKCEMLLDVYCQAEKLRNNTGSGEGLYTSPDAFKDSYPEYMTVHVPAASIEAYRSTEPWSLFKEVVALEGGDTPAAQKCATPEISYADGKLEFTCTTEGVEFVSEVTAGDAKKYYDASVTLSQTYKVSVYATKAGYEDSDVATREIVLGSGQTSPSGDINNDSKVNIADVVMLLDIILNK